MIEDPRPDPRPDRGEDPPPVLGTWGRVYGAVLVYLAVVIALFSWFGSRWG